MVREPPALASRSGLTPSGATVTEQRSWGKRATTSLRGRSPSAVRNRVVWPKTIQRAREEGQGNHITPVYSHPLTSGGFAAVHQSRGTGGAEGNEFPTQLVTVVACGLDPFVSFEFSKLVNVLFHNK